MKELIIEKSFSSPEVNFNPTTGEFKLGGRSIPENPDYIYLRMLEWIHEYFKDPCDLTQVVVMLEYVNSGSSKFLLEIFRVMKRYHDQGHECVVDWYYEEEDERIMELGTHYASTTELPFNMHVMH